MSKACKFEIQDDTSNSELLKHNVQSDMKQDQSSQNLAFGGL